MDSLARWHDAERLLKSGAADQARTQYAALTADPVLAALHDPFYYVRAEAVKTLAAMKPSGEKSRIVLQALEAKKNDENEYVTETVQSAITALTSDE